MGRRFIQSIPVADLDCQYILMGLLAYEHSTLDCVRTESLQMERSNEGNKMTTQLQTVLDALSDERYVTRYSQIEEAIAIVRGMMSVETVAHFYADPDGDYVQLVPHHGQPITDLTPLYAAPAVKEQT
jgi:hypothetical protein